MIVYDEKRAWLVAIGLGVMLCAILRAMVYLFGGG